MLIDNIFRTIGRLISPRRSVTRTVHAGPRQIVVNPRTKPPVSAVPAFVAPAPVSAAPEKAPAKTAKARRTRRRARGAEAVTTSKITPEQAREIVELYEAGGTRREDLAEAYGISRSQVQRILKGQCWGHTTGLCQSAPVHVHRKWVKKSMVNAIERELADHPHETQASIARRLGVSQGTVSRVARGVHFRQAR